MRPLRPRPSKRCKPGKKFNLSSWKLMCKVDMSEQACIKVFEPMRRLLSSSSQSLFSVKRGPKKFLCTCLVCNWYFLYALCPGSTGYHERSQHSTYAVATLWALQWVTPATCRLVWGVSGPNNHGAYWCCFRKMWLASCDWHFGCSLCNPQTHTFMLCPLTKKSISVSYRLADLNLIGNFYVNLRISKCVMTVPIN